ncbi:MAG: hypothetical protein V1792_07470 [Pseudomonadota bacterium]
MTTRVVLLLVAVRMEEIVAEFTSFEPGVQVSGDAVRAFSEGFPAHMTAVGQGILLKHGIANPGPGTFYLLQSFLDAMREISERFGSQMLFRIGHEIARNAKLPPGMDLLENCLKGIDTAYHMNHRGGSIGSYTVSSRETGSLMNAATIVCANPYPCSFDRGVIEGFAQRFKPPDCIDIIVRHDDSQPCRKIGAKSCTYSVSWV